MKTYMEITELHDHALAAAHPFQKTSLERMAEKGWKVFRVLEKGDTTLVFLSYKPGVFGVLYPNGSFDRVKAGRKTVDVSWSKARDLAREIAPAGAAALTVLAA